MLSISRNKQFFILVLVLLAGVVPAIFAQEQIKGAGQSGLFSIGPGRTVVFSQGNLQCRKNADDSYNWKFADNQYDRLKEQNVNIGDDGVWFDLFGYGTSNFSQGRTTFQPEQSSTRSGHSQITNFIDFLIWLGKLVFGIADDYPGSDLRYPDQQGSYSEYNMDWGLNSIMANGELLKPGTWATLTQSEWNYVLNQRPDASVLRFMYTIHVNGENIEGLVLLPDERIDLDASMPWNALESEGAVFLPCSGIRYVKDYQNYAGHSYNPSRDNDFKGYYWSSTCSGTTARYLINTYDAPYAVHFDENGSILLDYQFVTFYGMSVRLARETNIPVIFNYGDGTPNDTVRVMYGDPLPASPRTPAEPRVDDCYFNKFTGWGYNGRVLANGTRIFKEVTLTPQYTEVLANYTVVYKDWDGTTLDSFPNQGCRDVGIIFTNYQPRRTPSCDTIPTRPDDACKQYRFKGWHTAQTVTRDTVYIAEYDSADIDHYVTWYDRSRQLQSDKYHFGDTIVYLADRSTYKDANYVYFFDGWVSTEVTDSIMPCADVRFDAQYTRVDRWYDVTVTNRDSSTTVNVEYDSVPDLKFMEYDITECDSTYTFNGWTPEMPYSVKTFGVSFTANYSDTLNLYTMTWVDSAGIHTYRQPYDSLLTVQQTADTVLKANDLWIFDGWNPTPESLNGVVPCQDTTFEAQYHNIPRYYDVTYIYRDENESGEWDTLTTTHQYGADLNPDSLETEKWYCDSTHIFQGWSPALEQVNDTSEKTFIAQYNDTLNLYTMTWVDSAGIHTCRQPYDSLLTVQQTADTVWRDNYIWIFDGWRPDPVTELTRVPCNDTTFVAEYYGIPRLYDITYIYRDENIVGKWDTTIVQHRFGDILNPDSLETERWYCDSTHIFQGWSPALEQVSDTSAKTFVAQYTDTANIYNVVWKNWDGSVLSIDRLEYQNPISAPANPTRPTDATNVYFFAGWNPNPTTQLTNVPCHDTSFVAQYTSAPRYYDVTVVLKDSSATMTGEYDSVPDLNMYETTFVHCDSTYTFHHWTPAIHAQSTTSDTYAAVYTVTVNKYYVTWSDYDGATLRVDTLECGEMPSYTPDPIRLSDCDNDYTFASWSPAVTAVTQNVTYTATYTAVLRDYYITWKNWNDTILRIDTVHCSDMPTFTPDPYRPGDSQIAYHFNSWTPVVSPVTSDAEYIAQYDSAEAYIVYDSLSYMECFGTILKLPSGGYYSVKNDTVLIVHKHFNVIPFPETDDILDCDSVFTVNITIYKKPDFDMSLIACPEAILGMPIALDQTTSDILSFFTGAEDQLSVVDSWWEIYEQRKWSVYDGHRILSKDPIKLRFYMATEPCGDTLYVDYPSDECSLDVKDANADNCEDCNEIDCVDALYDWLLIYKNRYMRDTLGYDVPTVSVSWYKVQGDLDDLRYPEECDDKQIDVGYYLTIDQDLKGTGSYYALVDVRNCKPDTLPCRGIIRSHIFHYQGAAHMPSVSLIPTETEQHGLLTISGLDPTKKTQIYVYDMTGKMMLTTNVKSDKFEFAANAPDGVYRVLVLSDNMKETLTFIVK